MSQAIEQAVIQARVNRWDVVIEQAKAYAKDNYDNGMDFYVECYDQEQWVQEVSREDGTLMTWKEVKKEMKDFSKLRSDHIADVRGYSDCDAEEAHTPTTEK